MNSKEMTIILLSPILGFLAFLIPEIFGSSINVKYIFNASFIQAIYESMIPIPTLSLLIIIGIILGFISPRLWFLSGVLTLSIFPIVAFCEMITNPTSHNLWPIEFILYFVFTIPAIGGAYIGNRVKNLMNT